MGHAASSSVVHDDHPSPSPPQAKLRASVKEMRRQAVAEEAGGVLTVNLGSSCDLPFRALKQNGGIGDISYSGKSKMVPEAIRSVVQLQRRNVNESAALYAAPGCLAAKLRLLTSDRPLLQLGQGCVMIDAIRFFVIGTATVVADPTETIAAVCDSFCGRLHRYLRQEGLLSGAGAAAVVASLLVLAMDEAQFDTWLRVIQVMCLVSCLLSAMVWCDGPTH